MDEKLKGVASGNHRYVSSPKITIFFQASQMYSIIPGAMDRYSAGKMGNTKNKNQ